VCGCGVESHIAHSWSHQNRPRSADIHHTQTLCSHSSHWSI